jgi:imidazolonepropionase-like amidohydrolase
VQRFILFAVLAALVAACDPAADRPGAAPADQVTVLTGARLIDGTGGQPIENAVLVLRGERIESVGPAGSVTIPEGAEVIDVAGRTIMPGIINLHGHLALTDDGFDNHARHFNESNIREKLNQYARYGVLHVVSMGTDKPLVFDIRDRSRAGELPGARLYTAGRGFGAVGGYPPFQPGSEGELDAYRPTSPEPVASAVAEQAANNVDFIKMWVEHSYGTVTPIPPEVYQQIIQEAGDHGIPAVAHMYTLEDANRLVDAGVSGLIHSVRDQPVDAGLIQKMRAQNVFYVPTLVREEVMFVYAGRAPYLDDPFFTAHHPQSVIDRLEDEEFQAQHHANPLLDRWRRALAMAQQNLKTLVDAGVRVGFGSDSGPVARWEGYFEHREMELMAEAGLTPAQIIQIATRNSAEILGIEADYGTIEAGKMAEFLVLGANPLENISNTKTLEQVWQNGQRIHQQ